MSQRQKPFKAATGRLLNGTCVEVLASFEYENIKWIGCEKCGNGMKIALAGFYDRTKESFKLFLW